MQFDRCDRDGMKEFENPRMDAAQFPLDFEYDNKICRRNIIYGLCWSFRASFLLLFSSLALLLIASHDVAGRRFKKKGKKEGRKFYRFVFIILFARARSDVKSV